MASLIDAPRGADLLLSYIFPDDTDLGGYGAAFTVYGERNGEVLLSVDMTPTANGSALSVAGNLLSLAVRAGDIDALPVNGDDATMPALLWFDLIVTTPTPDVCKLYGGLMRILPYGAHTVPEGGVIEVALGGQSIAIEIAEAGFDLAVLAQAEGYAAAAQTAAGTAATEAATATTEAAVAAAWATAAATSAADAATSLAAASGFSATAAASATTAETAAMWATESAANATAAAAAVNTVGANVAAAAVAAADSATTAQAEAVIATAQAVVAANQSSNATTQAAAAAASAAGALASVASIASYATAAAGSATAAAASATTATSQATTATTEAGIATTQASDASTSATAAAASAASINGVARNTYDPSRIMVWEDNSPQELILAAIDLATGQFSFTPDTPTATSLASADAAQVDIQGLAYGSGRRMISRFQPLSKTSLGTVTTGAADAALTNVYSYTTSPALMYHDGVVMTSGNIFGSAASYYPHGSGGNLGSFSQTCGKLSVMTNAQKIQFRIFAASPSKFRLYVNGVPACDPTACGASVGDGTTYVQIDMGSPSTKGRLVTLETENNVGKRIDNTIAISATTGISVAGNVIASSIWAPASTYRRKLGIVGDSYSTSTGASCGMNGWLPEFCRLVGGMDCNPITEAYGGTGYLNPGALGSGTITGSVAGNTGTYADPNRISTFTQTGYTPDILGFFGGQNDYGSATTSALQTAVQTTLTNYRTALPGVPFWVNGIWPSSDGPSSAKIAAELAVQAAVNAMADPLIIFSRMSVGVPDNTYSMYYGTGHLAAPNGTGPSDFITGGASGADTVHPTDNGHRWIAANRYAEFQRVAAYFQIAS